MLDGANSPSAPETRQLPGIMPEHNSIEEQQAQLLSRIAAQDRSALAEFYDQTAPGLFAFALRMLGNRQDAEEVIQDVFVQVWTKARTFNPALGLAFSWVVGIARNRCIDRLRARQRRARAAAELERDVQVEEAANRTADEKITTHDELGALRSAMGSLPADQRQAIEMAFFGGLSHQEVAQALHQPLGTIKARIRRGMLKLRQSVQSLV